MLDLKEKLQRAVPPTKTPSGADPGKGDATYSVMEVHDVCQCVKTHSGKHHAGMTDELMGKSIPTNAFSPTLQPLAPQLVTRIRPDASFLWSTINSICTLAGFTGLTHAVPFAHLLR